MKLSDLRQALQRYREMRSWERAIERELDALGIIGYVDKHYGPLKPKEEPKRTASS